MSNTTDTPSKKTRRVLARASKRPSAPNTEVVDVEKMSMTEKPERVSLATTEDLSEMAFGEFVETQTKVLKKRERVSDESLDSPERKKRKIEVPGAPTKAKRSEAAQQTAAKHWCFTWNNPMGDDGMMYDIVKEWPTDYLVFQREQGESGTVHLQGYVEFAKPMRFNGLKKMPFGGMFTWRESTSDRRPIIIIK